VPGRVSVPAILVGIGNLLSELLSHGQGGVNRYGVDLCGCGRVGGEGRGARTRGRGINVGGGGAV